MLSVNQLEISGGANVQNLTAETRRLTMKFIYFLCRRPSAVKSCENAD
jgi:hypothetical protein